MSKRELRDGPVRTSGFQRLSEHLDAVFNPPPAMEELIHFDTSNGKKPETLHEVSREEVIQGLESPLRLDQLVERPNARDFDEVIQIVNRGKAPNAIEYTPTPGKLIDPGKIGIISYKGQIQLLQGGKYWALPNLFSKWVDVVPIDQTLIQYETLTIIRVQNGEYGLASLNSTPLILDQGLHVYNDRNFKFERRVSVNFEHLTHGGVHIIRVPKGKYASVTEGNNQKLLPEGIHACRSLVFSYNRLEDVNQEYIHHGTLHILRVNKGKVALVSENNLFRLLPEGTHCFNSSTFVFHKFEASYQPLIKHGTITRFRIVKGEIGLAWEGQKPKLFVEDGVYERDDPNFRFERSVPATDQYIEHGTIKRFTIRKGEIGLAWEGQKPTLLKEDGIFVRDEWNFRFQKCVPVTANLINHGTISRFRVLKGEIGLAWLDQKPKLFNEGIYEIDDANFVFDKCVLATEQCIKHGTISRFRVLKGEIGLAWEDSKPQFFDEGVYEKDDPNFVFVRCVAATEKRIELGSRKIITVWDGEVGVSYKKGKLLVLKPDSHHIDSADHTFNGMLSTQQQCLHLIGDKKSAAPESLVCETKDFVEIAIRADVFYRVVDPERVLMVVGQDNITKLVMETSIATLNGIVRSTSLAEVAQSKEPQAKSNKKFVEGQPVHGPSAPMFFDKVHDEFISKLHDAFIDKYGIEITNIRIESFKILNQELANNISKQALTTATTETQLANLASQTEIATAQQMRDAEILRIKAQSEANRINTETEAKNKATMNTAKTSAEALLVQARAEADAIVIRAEAEAKAIQLKAEAEGDRAMHLMKTPLGGQMALQQINADMIRQSMQGVEKMVYVVPEAGNTSGWMNSLFVPQIFASQALAAAPAAGSKAAVVADQ
eukprot:TRINITY_DN267_c0_g2_i4.p1 TRINITY_DN267_c0_g2~~TRINITY_DN267_c0_g2_i4.p1  ORF type:complete len:889 (+),score=349.16 TRINITY_DN267_c0_g2_i4:54-2720(+)